MPKKKKKKNLNNQLGWFVGEYIIDNHLPTISVDEIKTRRVIQCTISEADEMKRVSNEWSKKYYNDSNSPEATSSWNEYLSYRYELQNKYLPEELKCRIPKITPTNLLGFKEGLVDALWNCDICHYSLKHDDIIIEEGKYVSVIKLKLNKVAPLLGKVKK